MQPLYLRDILFNLRGLRVLVGKGIFSSRGRRAREIVRVCLLQELVDSEARQVKEKVTDTQRKLLNPNTR